MIYYTADYLNKITNRIYDLLKPGGILLTTEEESKTKELLQKFLMKTHKNLCLFVKPITKLDMEFQELFFQDNHISESRSIYNLNNIDFPKNKNDVLKKAVLLFNGFNYEMSFKYYYKLLNIKFNEKYLLKMIACLENLNMYSEAKKWQYTYLLSTIPNEFQIKKYLDLCIKIKDFEEYDRVLSKL
jgi:ubiquinone/menaquinone biosynthesis C-methylase UbiE